MLKPRSTPNEGEQKAQMREWSTETNNAEFHIPAIPYRNRNVTVKNSQGHSLPSGLTLGNAPDAPIEPGHASQQEKTLENLPRSTVTSFTCKDTITPRTVIFQWEMLNFKLYTYLVVL